MTAQPTWKLLANLGDAHPIDHGGYFVFEDTTGVYAPEAELLEEPADDGPQQWTVRRFPLDRCKLVDGYLVPLAYQADWSHPVASYDEWFHKDLDKVAASIGDTVDQLREALCAEDPLIRAQAYRAIGEYHGYDNLDSYPQVITDRADVIARIAGWRTA